ncbi:uncharacterized protein LOC123550418 [Mercenaria mercenaria]|uniref:uncharacterized protein LOC123550418 n=1 Tax=Mercenaria mercenaria TaxID=6596 RepID=UPI00234F9F3E|nr:uncharacterized protein LOC123550418 [Mercenaria mercenaria]
MAYSTALACFDSSVGIMPVVAKLPSNLQERWATKVYHYKEAHSVLYPPFGEFCKFINEQSKIRNDPSLLQAGPTHSPGQSSQSNIGTRYRRPVVTRKTDVFSENSRNLEKYCLLHRSNHSLNKCRLFKSISFEERKKFLSDQKICFRCCESNKHRASNCKVNNVKCDCGSTSHPGAMHIDQQQRGVRDNSQQIEMQMIPRHEQQDGGERKSQVNNSCTQICKNDFAKSCTKLVVVNVCRTDNPCKTVRCYAMIDDQSNPSLAKPELFDMLNITSQKFKYTINSCAGSRVTHGRHASDYDLEFLDLMDKGFRKTSDGRWSATLPFRSSRSCLPNNRTDAMRRAKSLHFNLMKNPVKRNLMVEFMAKIFHKGHAEVAPPLSDNEECWYLPVFGVFHPKKPDQIRAVFDSSAQFQGVSLNSVLLSGPDLINNLVGVLMRFRTELVPAIADIEQMFYCFLVEEKHRNFLRFLWYKDNDPSKEMIEYRMTVHVFGNSSSPAVAIYGLLRTVENSEPDVQHFVRKNFYVDDGLTSKSSPGQIVDLIKRTQKDLGACGLRLHKIASSNVEVMRSFEADDLAKDMKCLDFESDMMMLPLQRSLGVSWNLELDCFTFKVESSGQPFTRRGILATVNSLFDPLGFLSPFTIIGKLILRDIVSEKCDWDQPVPCSIERRWIEWKHCLDILSNLKIPRSYFSISLSEITHLTLHVFSDASEQAIAAVGYIVGRTPSNICVGFVMGKSKVAPTKGHTIPRLELCGAVLATEISQSITDQIGLKFDKIKYYTDSRIVLGYIHNQSRRFHTYVSNRVHKIRRVSEPSQWNYVPSEQNPADVGSRGVSPVALQKRDWFSGPDFLHKHTESVPEFFPVVDPETDKEIRPSVSVNAVSIQESDMLNSKKFEQFSTWSKLVLAISVLRHVAVSYNRSLTCRGWHSDCLASKDLEFRKQTESFILKIVQKEFYSNEIQCLKGQHNLNKDSPILTLDPFLDNNGILCVGGRLSNSALSDHQKHPVIVPGKHYVARLLVGHFHSLVKHQGRHLTESAVRDAGFWVIGGKRLVTSLIFQCVTCKKLRGKFLGQKMSNLPVDRVQQAAPFTYVGVDVFGPWSLVSRRTRGWQASSKRWAVLFTCLAIRAVHIEVIDEMSSSSFINALRRFVSLRGAVKQFRSDRGTNFVGATDFLGIEAINVEDSPMRNFTQSQGFQWVFNPPHASHMGGSWERLIGIARRILESMIRTVTTLTHDVLVTLMAEITAIINSRPLVPVSNDPDNPEVLSPSMLLTSKVVYDTICVGDLDVKSLYGVQWKRVQYLAEQFWGKWRREYLNTLQNRRKWNYEQQPLCVNDIVLLKDRDVNRISWPMARVTRVFPSKDEKIRTVQIIVFNDGKQSTYVRPVHELILLVKAEK